MVKQETGEAANGSNQSVPKAAVTVKQEPSDDSGTLRTLKRKSESVGGGGGEVKQENGSKKVKLENGDASGKKKKKKRSKNKGPKGWVWDPKKWEEDHKALLDCTPECRRGARDRCQQCRLQSLVENGEYPQDHGWKELDSGLWISRDYSIQNGIWTDIWKT